MENGKKNWFVRILIILFCIGLVVMISVNFFCVEPYGELKNGVFYLLFLLLVLVLAESFDNFSIGKVLSVKREIQHKESENKKLEQKNTELISHLISITNSQTQKQQSTNIFGDYYSDIPKDLQPINNDNVQELIDSIGNSPTITDFEDNIKRVLVDRGLDVTGETVKVLLRHLAGTQLILAFEKTHSIIFGSQLYLLKQLNSSPEGISEENVSQFFGKVKLQFIETLKNWTVENYLSYLYSNLLITKTDNTIYLTNFGVEYLTWIVRNGVSEDKPL
jgi:uncharacterized membrane protein